MTHLTLRVFDNDTYGLEIQRKVKLKKTGIKRWSFEAYGRKFNLNESAFQLRRSRLGTIDWILYGRIDKSGKFVPLQGPDKALVEPWPGWKSNAMQFVARKTKESHERFTVVSWTERFRGLIMIGILIVLFFMILYLFRQLGPYVDGLEMLSKSMQHFSESQLSQASRGTIVQP